MKSTFTTTICIAFTIAALPANAFSQPSYSQSYAAARGQRDPGIQQVRTTNQRVGFRMAEWNVIHGTDPGTTTETIATLESIGCEVTTNDHGNHRDIRFRCVDWSSIPVSNADQAAQWLSWLSNNSFETLVLNPENDPQLPTVQFRREGIQTLHAGSQVEVDAIAGTYQMLGCRIEVASHGDHVDVRMSCPDWTTIGLPNDQSAHTWQAWLDNNGFETRHEHAHGNASGDQRASAQRTANPYPVQRAAYPPRNSMRREPIGTTAFGRQGQDEVRAGYNQYTQAGPQPQRRAAYPQPNAQLFQRPNARPYPQPYAQQGAPQHSSGCSCGNHTP